jgi:Tol biopolymer transport system component
VTRAAGLLAVVALSASCMSSAERPRERHIVFDRGPWIWIADGEGGNQRRLVQGSYAFVSPDGHRIAYGRKGEIRVVNSKGTNDRSIGEGHVEDWLPDSRRLLAVRDRSLVVLDVDDGGTETVISSFDTDKVYGIDLSEAGDRVTYAMAERTTRWGILRDRMDVYVVPISGGSPKRITYDRLSAWPVWSGDEIVFSRLPRDNRLAPGIWRMSADGTNVHAIVPRSPRRFTRGGYYGLRPYYREGERTIVGVRSEWGDVASVLPRDGSVRLLNAYLGHVSRDGRYVLGVQGGAEFPFTVVIAPVDGGKPKTIASGEITWEHWNR